MAHRVKKLLIQFAKIGISLGILAYLAIDVWHNHPGLFRRLWEEPKRWDFFLLAWMLILSAVMLSFVRWFFLVRALDLPFRLRDAFRLGFLGYLFNFVSLGSVGGDLFKAVFIAREQEGRRTAAVATVVVDRFIGLVGLVLIASAAVLLTDMTDFRAEFQTLGKFTLLAASIAMLVFFGLMFRFGTEGPIADFLCEIPRVGDLFQRIYEAARAYQKQRAVLLLALMITFGTHGLNVLGFYCIARGLPDTAPSLAVHFLIIPIGMVSGALPLPGGGLGAFEAVMKELYAQVMPAQGNLAQGLVVALVYRIITILVAITGVVLYLTRRREVDRAMHDAESLEEESESTDSPSVATI